MQDLNSVQSGAAIAKASCWTTLLVATDEAVASPEPLAPFTLIAAVALGLPCPASRQASGHRKRSQEQCISEPLRTARPRHKHTNIRQVQQVQVKHDHDEDVRKLQSALLEWQLTTKARACRQAEEQWRVLHGLP